jgi:hypothetical protein
MIGRLDDILNKFVAVFLFPIVNLICISFIVYWCARGFNVAGLVANFRLSGDMSDARLGFVTQFVQDNLSVITAITSAYGKQIANLSFVMAMITSALLVLVLYLFDRLTFYAGYLLTPAFNFDIDRYGRAATNAARAQAVRAILQTEHALGATYGVIRAYLGEKNTDVQRLRYRAGLLRSLESTAVAVTYIKSYVLLTALLLICSVLFASALSPLATLVVLVLAIVVLGCALNYFSICCRRLVDFDVESFIWDRAYNAEVGFNPAVLAVIPEARPVRAIGPWYLNPSMLSRDLL